MNDKWKKRFLTMDSTFHKAIKDVYVVDLDKVQSLIASGNTQDNGNLVAIIMNANNIYVNHLTESQSKKIIKLIHEKLVAFNKPGWAKDEEE